LLRGISPTCGNKWGCKIVKTTQKPSSAIKTYSKPVTCYFLTA
jgi:hypothetical protein